MSLRTLLLALMMSSTVPLALAGCGDDDADDDDDDSDAGGDDSELCTRLGGQSGVNDAVGGFVGRVLADPKINGYFLNASVLENEEGEDAPRLVRCLNEQVGNAVGCDTEYTCNDMATVHAGLGISDTDFDDLVGHLVDELEERDVAEADIATIGGVLGGLEGDIVTDPTHNGTIYQRLGRRPAIEAVIGTFIDNVVADEEINTFFGGLDDDGVARLKVCLVRQVCGAAGGPCKYGEEAGPDLLDPGACRGMTETHDGLEESTPGGGDDTAGIDIGDFNALVADLVEAVPEALRSSEDATALVGVVNSLCPMIVVEADRADCPE